MKIDSIAKTLVQIKGFQMKIETNYKYFDSNQGRNDSNHFSF